MVAYNSSIFYYIRHLSYLKNPNKIISTQSNINTLKLYDAYLETSSKTFWLCKAIFFQNFWYFLFAVFSSVTPISWQFMLSTGVLKPSDKWSRSILYAQTLSPSLNCQFDATGIHTYYATRPSLLSSVFSSIKRLAEENPCF